MMYWRHSDPDRIRNRKRKREPDVSVCNPQFHSVLGNIGNFVKEATSYMRFDTIGGMKAFFECFYVYNAGI